VELALLCDFSSTGEYDMLNELFQIIEDRKANPTNDSYTAKLLEEGEDRILQKIGEEAVELILAAKGQGNQRLVEETADLFYHILVILAAKGLTLEDVESELRMRHEK
jgi:phosphoribosyl-ATP pyrophosphohydrolase